MNGLRRRVSGRRSKGSARERDLSLAIADIASDRIDFVAWLYRLRYQRKTRSITCGAAKLFERSVNSATQPVHLASATFKSGRVALKQCKERVGRFR
jgi:hypothetical protein